MTAVLKPRQQRLKECEAVLLEHFEEFVRVGQVLSEIRDQRLFEEAGFSDFDTYCRRKWDISRSRADQLISSSDIRLMVRTNGTNAWTERAIRPLKALEHGERARIGKIVARKAKKSGETITGTFVRRVIREELGIEKEKPAPRPEPGFARIADGWVGEWLSIAETIERIPDDALALFTKTEPKIAKKLATAIERLEKALERLWNELP